MSTNINNVKVIALDAKIAEKDLREFRREGRRSGIAEINFLDEANGKEPDADGFVRLRGFDWSGEFSGRTYETLVREIAPKIVGRVDAVFVWETGDLTGLVIEDGDVAECDVALKLVPKAGAPYIGPRALSGR